MSDRSAMIIAMPDMYSDLVIANRRGGSFDVSSSESYRMTTCGSCGPTQAGVVGYSAGNKNYWLRCSNCGRGIVEVSGKTYPESRPLSEPLGLPPAEQDAWSEVRDCLSVGASTAAVMICRKILLHLAVGAGLPAKDEKDRAPSFVAAVTHLRSEGLITPKMVAWVDRIKDVGNEANHELQPIMPELALDVAQFTEQLLRLTYEMDALMARGPESGDGEGAQQGVVRGSETWHS